MSRKRASVMRTATEFEETLHPFGGAEQSMLQIVAAGYLPDGRTFQLVAVEAAGELRHVRIDFGGTEVPSSSAR